MQEIPQDANWTKNLNTLRLGFLNLGPEVKNLNLTFKSLTTVFLQYNKIQKVDDNAFIGCPNLKFIALQNN